MHAWGHVINPPKNFKNLGYLHSEILNTVEDTLSIAMVKDRLLKIELFLEMTWWVLGDLITLVRCLETFFPFPYLTKFTNWGYFSHFRRVSSVSKVNLSSGDISSPEQLGNDCTQPFIQDVRGYKFMREKIWVSTSQFLSYALSSTNLQWINIYHHLPIPRNSYCNRVFPVYII